MPLQNQHYTGFPDIMYLKGGIRKIGQQKRNRRKNKGQRAREKKHEVEVDKSDTSIFFRVSELPDGKAVAV